MLTDVASVIWEHYGNTKKWEKAEIVGKIDSIQSVLYNHKISKTQTYRELVLLVKTRVLLCAVF